MPYTLQTGQIRFKNQNTSNPKYQNAINILTNQEAAQVTDDYLGQLEDKKQQAVAAVESVGSRYTTAYTNCVQATNNANSALSYIAPVFSTSAVYKAGDLVIYDGDIYCRKTDATASESWISSHWVKTSISNEVQQLTDNLALAQTTQPTSNYNKIWFPMTENEVSIATEADVNAVADMVAQEYDSTKTYSVGDYCRYNNQLYRCITEISTSEDWTAEHWTAVMVGSEVSDLKSAFESLLDDTNLFDDAIATDGKRLSTTGTLVTATNHYTSQYIPVIAGKTYIKNSPVEDGYHKLCVFDSTKTFITGAAYNNNVVTIPEGGAFVKFCGEISEKETAYLILVGAKDALARENIANLDREIDELSAKKMDKPKEYTIINGTVNTGVLWNYSSNAESTGKDAYQYAVINSGFTPGTKYAFDGYQPTNTTIFAAIAFYNSNNVLIETVIIDGGTNMEKLEHVVPYDTAAIYISGMNAHYNAKMYSIGYMDIDMSGIVLDNEYAATNWMDRRYQDGEFETYGRKTANHLIVTFSVDDSHADISDIATAFDNAGVPLCLATIPEYLDNVCNNGETVLEVCAAVQNRGGEILTHNISPLGASSTPDKYKKYFVTSKKTLTDAGLIVNGIIKAGGTEPGGAPSIPEMLRYLRSYYDYATGFSTVGDGRYTIGRARLKADTDFDAIKAQIDSTVGGGYLNFYTHGQTDFPDDNTWLSKIMDLVSYIKGKTNAEIVTIGNMFKQNFIKSFKA